MKTPFAFAVTVAIRRGVARPAAQVELVIGERLPHLAFARLPLVLALERLLHQVEQAALAEGARLGLVAWVVTAVAAVVFLILLLLDW